MSKVIEAPELQSKPIVGKFREENLDQGKLPAVEVKNTVIFVNPEIDIPLDLKEGEPTKLGVFLTPLREGENPETLNLEVRSGHNRSAMLGRAVFKDKQGRLYRDIDVKGMGYVRYLVERTFVTGQVKLKKDYGFNTVTHESFGLLKLGAAFHDKEMAEAFLEKGIRTHRVAAIISLEEIIDERGIKIDLEQARQRSLIPEAFKPVIAIRAYGTKFRLDDLAGFFSVSKSSEEVEAVLKDAMTMVAQELGKKPEEFSKKDYLIWLAETLATNIARMHNNGWYHGFLTFHNLTLDGRITDLDSVGWLDKIDSPIKKVGDDFSQFLNDFIFFLEKTNFAEQFGDPYLVTRKIHQAYNQEIKTNEFNQPFH